MLIQKVKNFSFENQLKMVRERYFSKKMKLIMTRARNSELNKRIAELERTVYDLTEEKGRK